MKKEKEKVNQKTIINTKPIKQSKKLNQNNKRTIFWGIIWLIILICSFIGYWSFDNGYGDSGQLRSKLKPIVSNFNNLNGVKKYNSAGIKIESKLTKNSIVINYITSSSKATFNFEYVFKNNKDTLHLKYNSSDETTANAIIVLMLDAISVTQGHNEGDLLSRYTLDMFKTTTIEDGIQLIENTDNSKEIYININNSILDKDNNQYIQPENPNPEEIINPEENIVPEENTNVEENLNLNENSEQNESEPIIAE